MTNEEKRELLYSCLRDKQKAFCDLVLDHIPPAQAYNQAYGLADHKSCVKSANALLKYNDNVINYITFEKDIQQKQELMTKGDLIYLHKRIIDTYASMLNLLSSDTPLSKEQKEKLRNYQNTIKTSDFRSALIEIGKLQGDYVEKIEVTQKQVIRLNTGEDLDEIDGTVSYPHPLRPKVIPLSLDHYKDVPVVYVNDEGEVEEDQNPAVQEDSEPITFKSLKPDYLKDFKEPRSNNLNEDDEDNVS